MTPSPARPIFAAEKPALSAATLPCLLIAAGIFLSGCASTEGELAAVREASRIAEEARRDQADQRADRERAGNPANQGPHDRQRPQILNPAPCIKDRIRGFFHPIPPTWWPVLKRR
jgi:hypothetical protein